MTTAFPIVDYLTRVSRASQIDYALHGYPGSNLTDAEVEMYIRVAGEVREGSISTALHRDIADKVSPMMLRYVVTGRMTTL